MSNGPAQSGSGEGGSIRVGVLASQGDFAAHIRMLHSLGAEATEVRRPQQLDGLDGLVIPGGESTTIMKALKRDGLDQAVRGFAGAGKPIFGTCAGMIVLDSTRLGLMEMTVERNAFGRQRQSFEADLIVQGAGPEPMRAVFIRAPWIATHGADVEVLAEVDGHPVVVRQGCLLACAFHPELTDDSRLHAMFMAIVSSNEGESATTQLKGGAQRVD